MAGLPWSNRIEVGDDLIRCIICRLAEYCCRVGPGEGHLYRTRQLVPPTRVPENHRSTDWSKVLWLGWLWLSAAPGYLPDSKTGGGTVPSRCPENGWPRTV
jgi:hypothetical protein